MESQTSLVALFVLAFISSDLFEDVFAATTCKPDGVCRCVLNDGSKRFFDLSPISRKGEPYFKLGVEESASTYYYDPCEPFNIESSLSVCQGVAGCVNHVIDKVDNYSSIALHSRVVFNYNDVGPNLDLKYDNGQSGNGFLSTTVLLVCRQDNVNSNFEIAFGEPPNYIFQILSPYGCLQEPKKSADKLSVGSILCIIFSVSVFVYFTGGFVLTIVVLKKSPGVEAIPNYEFWVDLPNLIKEGTTFCLSCVTKKGSSTYTETVPQDGEGADAFSGDTGDKSTKYDAI